MKVIAGLGNPGREYANTRHNVGFMVLRRLEQELTNPTRKHRFRSELAEGFLGPEKLILVAPETYMNLSGHAVREVLNWYHLAASELLVVFDDMDLPFGQLRMRVRGSAGGHNGLRSIVEQLGTTEVPRLRVGIGRGRSSATAHVLSRFSAEEEAALPALIERVSHGVLLWVREGPIAAMNDINRTLEPEPAPAATGGTDAVS